MLFTERFITRSCIVAYVIFGLLWLGLIYTFAGVSEDLDSEEFYPSKVMESDPERMIGAFMLPLMAISSAIIIGLRLRRMEPILKYSSMKRTIDALFKSCVWLTVQATISMIALGAISLESSGKGHFIFAYILFTSLPVLIFFINIMDEMISLDRPQWLRMFRIASPFATGGMAISMGFIRGTAFSLLEIALISSVTIYFSTFAHESDFVMQSTLASRCEIAPQYLQPARCSIVQQGSVFELRAD